MTTDEARAALTGKLIEAYGFSEGLRTAGVVAGPILRDFSEMIRRRADGSEVREEYKTEDGRAALVLTGKRTAGGEIEILSVGLV